MNIKLTFSGAVHKNIRIRGKALEFWAERYFESQLKNFPHIAGKKILIEFSEDFIFFPDKRQVNALLREGKCIKVFFNESWMKISTSSDASEERSISFSEIADDFDSLSSFKISSEILNLELFLINFQISDLLEQGVIIENFSDFYIEPSVKTGKNVFIGSGAVIKGDSVIGDNSVIYPSCFIENSLIGSDTTLLPGSVIRDSSVGKNVVIGPYTHLRQNTKVMDNCKMGNFVEMKKSVFGEGSKSMHLSYIGDASVGRRVNIGAGTITCNYDGVNKNPTTIGDDVFVGSGTELVAPVTLEDRSYVGAGSTITENVPKEALAVSRTRQRHIKNWYAHRKRK